MAEMTIAPVATHGFFVDGRWEEDGDIVEIRAPYDGSLIARVVEGRREHANAAIAAAVKAFGTTRRLPAFERQRVLRRISAHIAERKEEFARTLAQEAGKPIKGARIEVERAIFTFNVAAEESTRIYGEYLPLDWQEFTAGRWGIVRRFPLGPVAGIMICDRGRMPDGLEACAANTALLAASRRMRAAGRLARRRTQCHPALK
jgi:acyl-CoA reductase-like NAD-dependent aldehyde dehydrogenase